MKNPYNSEEQPYGESPTTTSSSFDWREYAMALKQRLWLILICAIGGVGTALYQVNKAVPIYASKAVLMLEAREDRVLKNIEAIKNDAISDTASFSTMLETLTSRTMMLRVALRLKLDRDFVFMPKPDGQEANPMESVVGVLRGCYRINKRGDTRLLDIVAEHTDPETAKKLADELAQEFLRFRFEAQTSTNEMASRFLIEEANRLKDKVNNAERLLHEFREKKGLISLEKDQDVVVSRFKELNTQSNQARDRRLQLEADMTAATQIGNKPAELLKLPSITQYPAVATLLTAVGQKEADLSLLAQRYKPKHPKYIALVTEMESLKKRLPEAAIAAAAVMANDCEAARLNEARLTQEVTTKEKDIYSLGKTQVEYDALKRDIETDKAILATVLARLKETDLTKGLDTSTIKSVEGAIASYVPVRPDKQKLLAQWSLGGIALGIILALALHLMDSSIKTVADAERTLDLRVLAAVTVCKTSARKNPKPDLETVHHTHSPVSEGFRTLRSSIMLLGAPEDQNIIMFTSAVPAEGKTFCASNYAVSLAQQGLSTVLVDCDLRKPSVGDIFLPKDVHLGVTEFLSGTCQMDEAIRPSGVANLDIFPAGTRSANPSELLSGRRFQAMLNELAANYERIVIDTPPVLAVSDALVVAPRTDLVCLVVRAQKTPRHSAFRTCAALAKAGKAPAGLVLNRLPIAAAGYYYYYAGAYGNKRVYGAESTTA